VKGGWLAAACAGPTTTLALSDVVGDDLSVIGSGPGVPDGSTWLDVRRALEARGVWTSMPASVRGRVDAGCGGAVPDTPKPGDPRLARAMGAVIGRAADAVDAMREAAASRGYTPIVMDGRVTGEARDVARSWLARARQLAGVRRGPVCVLSSGETTVRVSGTGVGGRNLEFALALVEPLAGSAGVVAASVGTDGIDGTSDVAGAVVDGETRDRARARGLPPAAEVLARNDSFHFFSPLGDAVRTGRTDTNVGDIQLLLVNP
jgi:hydroxypyruvate reductase